jgi:hypothetical protein
MKPNEQFTIEYVSPAVVRSGRYAMTDFALIYRDEQITIHLYGEGIWEKDSLVGYEIRLPKDLARLEPGAARVVWERVRDDVQSHHPVQYGDPHHRKVTMQPFSEAWERRPGAAAF